MSSSLLFLQIIDMDSEHQNWLDPSIFVIQNYSSKYLEKKKKYFFSIETTWLILKPRIYSNICCSWCNTKPDFFVNITKPLKGLNTLQKIWQAGTVQYNPKMCGERSLVLQWCTCRYGQGWWSEHMLSQMTHLHKCTPLCTFSTVQSWLEIPFAVKPCDKCMQITDLWLSQLIWSFCSQKCFGIAKMPPCSFNAFFVI